MKTSYGVLLATAMAGAGLATGAHANDKKPGLEDFIACDRQGYPERDDGYGDVSVEAIPLAGSDPVLLYDLGVLLDDLGRKQEALEAYQAALRHNPRLADCHYNLALLCERLGRPKDAIRYMARYRALVGAR